MLLKYEYPKKERNTWFSAILTCEIDSLSLVDRKSSTGNSVNVLSKILLTVVFPPPVGPTNITPTQV